MKPLSCLCLCLVATAIRADDAEPVVSAPDVVPPAETDAVPELNADEVASTLRELEPARSAYTRGLMPLHDLVAQVNAFAPSTNETDLAIRRAVYAPVVERLERFAQPAAIGWAADLTEARALLAVAESQSAATRWELSEQAIARRVADVAIGHARPADVAGTIEHLTPAGDSPAAVTQREAMELRARRAWAEQVRTGVGRRDEMLIVQWNAVGPGDPDRISLAEEAMVVALRFHESGTASLFDLATAYAMFEKSYLALPDERQPAYDDVLAGYRERLEAAANSMQDRRGRNAADVALVRRLLAETPDTIAAGPGIPYVDSPAAPPIPGDSAPIGDRVLEFTDEDR